MTINMDDILKYGLPAVLGIGLLYFLSQRQQPVAVAAAAPITPPAVPGLPGIVPTGVSATLAQMAASQGAPDYIIRPLIAQDLGLTDWSVTAAGAGWTNMINANVADQTWIAITGVSYADTTPTATQMRIQAGASYRQYWPLSFIAGLESAVWTAPSPVIAQQNQPVIIDVNFTAADTEIIVLMGVVAEKRGITIS